MISTAMMPEKTPIKKTDAINGAIKMLSVLYDVDWYPEFKNKRSLRKVINWMNSYKMLREHRILFDFAYALTYK